MGSKCKFAHQTMSTQHNQHMHPQQFQLASPMSQSSLNHNIAGGSPSIFYPQHHGGLICNDEVTLQKSSSHASLNELTRTSSRGQIRNGSDLGLTSVKSLNSINTSIQGPQQLGTPTSSSGILSANLMSGNEYSANLSVDDIKGRVFAMVCSC